MGTGKRESNIELLRILIMMGIVLSHYASHGGSYAMSTGINEYIAVLLTIGGKIAVNIFIVITGYYMIASDFKTMRIVRLELAVLFYSIVFYLGACFVWHIDTWNFGSIKANFFPTLMNINDAYWFVPCYMATVLIAPFMNRLVENLSKHQYKVLLTVLLLFVSVVPSLLFSKSLYEGNAAVFILLYLIGGYLNKYGENMYKAKNWKLLAGAVTICVIEVALIVNIKRNTESYALYGVSADMLRQCHYILMIAIGVLVFILFKNLHVPYNPAINKVAAGVIGIYLIHDNKYYRLYVWNNIFHTQDYCNSNWMIVHAAVCGLVVFG